MSDNRTAIVEYLCNAHPRGPRDLLANSDPVEVEADVLVHARAGRLRCTASTWSDWPARARSTSMPDPMSGRTLAFGHVGFQVRDLDRSMEYYRDVIGLELLDRLIRDEPYLSQVTGYPDVRLDIALLVEPDSRIMLELVEA